MIFCESLHYLAIVRIRTLGIFFVLVESQTLHWAGKVTFLHLSTLVLVCMGKTHFQIKDENDFEKPIQTKIDLVRIKLTNKIS